MHALEGERGERTEEAIGATNGRSGGPPGTSGPRRWFVYHFTLGLLTNRELWARKTSNAVEKRRRMEDTLLIMSWLWCDSKIKTMYNLVK